MGKQKKDNQKPSSRASVIKAAKRLTANNTVLSKLEKH